MADDLGLPKNAMCWDRHSWAIKAAELDISREAIAASMGYSGGTVTELYINFDRAKIDRANRQIINFVLHDKGRQTVQDFLCWNYEELRKQIAGNAG